MSFPRQVLPGTVYLITRRCTQRQFLLRPDEETNNAFVYCFAYAAKRAGLGVVAFVANSNHYHAVVVDTLGVIPKFLQEFHRLLARHQNILRNNRRENFWANVQTSLVELVGEEDILAKTLYTLTNPVKHGTMERAVDWPGASSLRATLHGATLKATLPQRAFRRGGTMPATIELDCVRPPALEHFTAAEYRQILEEGIAAVERDATCERQRTGRRALGAKAILAQSPFDRPSSSEPPRTLDPKIAARDKLPRIEALARLKAFRAAYRAALEAWLAGAEALFPAGTWSLRGFAKVSVAPAFCAA